MSNLNPNLVHLFPKVARAVEVAIAGNHTLQITGGARTSVEVILLEQVASNRLLSTNPRGGLDPQMTVEAVKQRDGREIRRLPA